MVVTVLNSAVLRAFLRSAFVLCAWAAAAAYAAAAGAEIRLSPQLIYPGITARIPEEFAPLSEAVFTLKYGNRSRRETVAFADANAEASLVFELKARPEDPALLKERIGKSLEKDPAIRRVSAAQTVIDGRPAVVFEFESQAVDTSVFNILFFIAAGLDKTLTGNFNCPTALEHRWKAAGREIIHGITID